jgi:ribonucleoside-diphosphate reductase alpha chain
MMESPFEVIDVFQLDDLGLKTFKRSYAYDENETWEQAARRVAEHVAAAEDPEKNKKWQRRFYGEIASNRFMPGGRIWYGSGRPKAQLLNCFVIPMSDSKEGWGDYLRESLIISATGGGVGVNGSAVRPNGTEVKGTGGYATGPVSVFRMDNSIGKELVTGGTRRMAKMWCINITHPDVVELIDSKLEDGTLSNGNISVVLNIDPKEFVKLVENDGDIEFEWGGRKTGGSVNAKALWERIVKNAWNNGEPGVLNGYYANEMNNIFYHKPLISTNPCGEIWLESYGCCDLGHLVLPRFVRDGKVDWEQLEETIRIGVRFLDDVLTVNQYPLEKIKENCEQTRRIGLGVMGLHSMLLKLGIKYSSDEAIEFCDKLAAFIKHTAYDTSINLAIEKGPFPAYSPEFVKSGFMKTMKRAIRSKVAEYGVRNCALLTNAPTGTTAIVSGVSTSIEPLMASGYWRTIIKDVDEKNGNVRERILVVEPEYDLYPDIVEGAADISVERHFMMQEVWQKHIDNAVSKTINLPNDYPIDELSAVWLKYLSVLKGTTFYRWGSRENEPFSPVKTEDLADVIASTPPELISRKQKTEDSNAMDCVTGVCDIPVRDKETFEVDQFSYNDDPVFYLESQAVVGHKAYDMHTHEEVGDLNTMFAKMLGVDKS